MRHASEDINAAARLSGNIYSAYHAQQAVEKAVLTLLTAEDINANTRSIGHRLDALLDLLPSENPFKSVLGTHEYLQAYATTFRYPKPSGRVNRLTKSDFARVDQSTADLRDIVKEIADHFVVDLDFDSDRPADNIEPPRTRGPKP
jgi:HEPN domain-containing protein